MVTGSILPGQRAIMGTRIPPSYKLPFQTAQRSDALEELVVDLLLQVRGAVVRREHHQRVVVQSQSFELLASRAPRIPVQPADHGRVGGSRRLVGRVAVTGRSDKRRLVPFAQVGLQFFVRDVQRHVRDRRREVQEERSAPVVPHETASAVFNMRSGA